MTSLHHVVLCVHPDRLDEVAAYWRGLGFTFTEIDLEEEGLRILLDWDGGIEILTPTTRQESSQRFWDFLEAPGGDVFSLVVRTDDIDAAVAASLAAGSVVEFRQHRDLGSATLDEVQLSPVLGTPVTFLQTDLD